MTPETSQTIPEKPRDGVSVEENNVPNERGSDWKREEGVQELQELQNFRSVPVGDLHCAFQKRLLDSATPELLNS
jgi:hypothetical protein